MTVFKCEEESFLKYPLAHREPVKLDEEGYYIVSGFRNSNNSRCRILYNLEPF